MRKKTLIAVSLLALGAFAQAQEFNTDLAYFAEQMKTAEIAPASMPAPEKAQEDGTGGDKNKSLLGGGISIRAFDAKLDLPQGFSLAGKNLTLKARWYCHKSSYFHPNGYVDCGDAYGGSQTIEIGPNGNFSFPKIKESGPLFRGYYGIDVSLEQDGKELQDIGTYSDTEFASPILPFSKLEEDLKSLTLILLKGGQYPASVIARETGQTDITYEQIDERYPGSYNKSVSALVRLTYDKTAGKPRENPWHATFHRAFSGKYEKGSVSFPDALWAISGFKKGTPVELSLEFGAAVYLKKDVPRPYKQVSVRTETTVYDIEAANLAPVAENFREVILSLD